MYCNYYSLHGLPTFHLRRLPVFKSTIAHCPVLQSLRPWIYKIYESNHIIGSAKGPKKVQNHCHFNVVLYESLHGIDVVLDTSRNQKSDLQNFTKKKHCDSQCRQDMQRHAKGSLAFFEVIHSSHSQPRMSSYHTWRGKCFSRIEMHTIPR